MSGTYKLVTVVGTSANSYEQALERAIQDASGSLRNLSWFEVKEQRGAIKDGKVSEYQIKVDVGFRVETP